MQKVKEMEERLGFDPEVFSVMVGTGTVSGRKKEIAALFVLGYRRESYVSVAGITAIFSAWRTPAQCPLDLRMIGAGRKRWQGRPARRPGKWVPSARYHSPIAVRRGRLPARRIAKPG